MVVSGNAALAGNLHVSQFGGFKPEYGQQFAFLQASRISGEFDTISTGNPSRFRARFLVDGGTGSILLAPSSYTLVAQTQNQHNVAKALNSFIPAKSGDEAAVSLALDLQSENQYQAAFNAIAPSFYESLTNIAIEQSISRTQMLSQRVSAVRLGARSFQSSGVAALGTYDKDGRSVIDTPAGKNVISPADDDNRNVWVQGNGTFADASGSNGASSFDFENGGFLVGLDSPVSEHLLTGVYAGYQGTYSKYANGGTTEIDGVDFGAYAGYENGGFYADALIGGGTSSYSVRRPIQFSTVDRTATSSPDGGQFTSELGFGYDFMVGNLTFGPVARGQYTYAGIDSFTEVGGGALGLAVDQQNANSLRTSLGGRIAHTWKVSERVVLFPEARLFWQEECLESSHDISSSLNGGSGPSFDYTTDNLARESVFGGAGISAQFGANWNTYFYYNTNFGREEFTSHSISTGLNFKF